MNKDYEKIFKDLDDRESGKNKKSKNSKDSKDKKDKKNKKDKNEKKNKKDKKDQKASKKKQKKKSLLANMPLLEASSDKDSPAVVFEVFAPEATDSESDNARKTPIEVDAEFITIEETTTETATQARQTSSSNGADFMSYFEDKTADRPQQAADLFQSDYDGPGTNGQTIRLSCAQSILLPYANTVGLNAEQSLDLGRGFAMGMMNDSTCGALVAAIMLAGLSGASLEDASTIYQEFQKRYGSTMCKDILEGPTTCRDIIKHACMLYEKYATSAS